MKANTKHSRNTNSATMDTVLARNRRQASCQKEMDLCISTMDSFSWLEAAVKSSSRMSKVSMIFSGSTWKGLILANVFFMIIPPWWSG